MEEQEGKGYEVIDKRGACEEPTEQPAKEPSPEQAEVHHEEPSADEQREAPHEEPVSITVYGMMQWFVAMLTESAWQYMGIQMNPATKKVEKDLVQAKIAVDTVVFLTDQLAPHVPEEQRRAYRALVSDLRVNFVQHSQE